MKYNINETGLNVLKSEEFIGRQEILDSIFSYFSTSSVKDPIIIHGLSGVGKTQIGLQYLNIYKSDYSDRVRWLNSESIESIRHSIRRFVEYLMDVDEVFASNNSTTSSKSTVENVTLSSSSSMSSSYSNISDDEVVIKFQKYLNECDDKWLLIFDDVMDVSMDTIMALLPKYQHDIILTTNNPSKLIMDDRRVKVFPYIKPFTDQESFEFVRSRLKLYKFTDIGEIFDFIYIFDNIPLGLDLGTSYINRVTTCTVPSYISAFKRTTCIDLLFLPPISINGLNCVPKSLLLSIEKIFKYQSSDAMNNQMIDIHDSTQFEDNITLDICQRGFQMFQILCYFCVKRISIKFIKKVFEINLIERFIPQLEEFNLISISYDERGNKLINIHSCIRDNILLYFDQEKRSVLTTAVDLFIQYFKAFPIDIEKPPTQFIQTDVYPHVLSVINQDLCHEISVFPELLSCWSKVNKYKQYD